MPTQREIYNDFPYSLRNEVEPPGVRVVPAPAPAAADQLQQQQNIYQTFHCLQPGAIPITNPSNANIFDELKSTEQQQNLKRYLNQSFTVGSSSHNFARSIAAVSNGTTAAARAKLRNPPTHHYQNYKVPFHIERTSQPISSPQKTTARTKNRLVPHQQNELRRYNRRHQTPSLSSADRYHPYSSPKHSMRGFESDEGEPPMKRVMMNRPTAAEETLPPVLPADGFTRRTRTPHRATAAATTTSSATTATLSSTAATATEPSQLMIHSFPVVYPQDQQMYFNNDLESMNNLSFASSYNAFLHSNHARLRHEQAIKACVLNNMMNQHGSRRNASNLLDQQQQQWMPTFQYYDPHTRGHFEFLSSMNQHGFCLVPFHQVLNHVATVPVPKSQQSLYSNGTRDEQMDRNTNGSSTYDSERYGSNRFEGIRRAGKRFTNDKIPSTAPQVRGAHINQLRDNLKSTETTTSVSTSSAMSFPMKMPDLALPVHYRNTLDHTLPVATDTSSATSSSSIVKPSAKSISDWNDVMLKHLFTKNSENSKDLSSLDQGSVVNDPNKVPVYRTPFPLGVPTDDLHLSEFFQFLRVECCEVFTASAQDVAERKKTKHTILHQVGIRCAFCVKEPYPSRALRSSCFPSSLSRIYQSVTMMVRDHFSVCPLVPADVRERYDYIKANSQRKGNMQSRSYWVVAAKMIGIEEREDGLFFTSDTPVDA